MLKLIKTTEDDCATVNTYACDFTVTTNGDGYWDCEAGRVVRVTEIAVSQFADDEDMGDYKSIYVKHNSTWDIYTDTAFPVAISAALGYNVGFTEQGMQEDYLASMET